MTATDPPAAVAAYYAAFRSGDVESWLAVFARDAEVANPAGAPPLHGAASLRELWEELTCPFRCVDLTEGLVVVTPPIPHADNPSTPAPPRAIRRTSRRELTTVIISRPGKYNVPARLR